MTKKAAFITGNYRNLLHEYGYSQKDIDEKLRNTWSQLFSAEHPETQIYYPVGNDLGYMLDTFNHDVRTEGMSYGMMMAVQMNDKDIFDRLWKWSKTYMYMDEGENAGYFAWSCAPDGTKNALGPAPDGGRIFCHGVIFCFPSLGRW